MKRILFAAALLCVALTGKAQTRTVHVFVALCDNLHQGIVPVPAGIGNGQHAATNLYWGAGYGVKTFFTRKSADWKLVGSVPSTDPAILDRLVFRHTREDVILLSEAYDGARMATCLEHFLLSSNRQHLVHEVVQGCSLTFGGGSDLVAFVGHNGLMDGDVEVPLKPASDEMPEAIMLACYSKSYFAPKLQATGAKPLLWTTHLMAPEAYVLEAALGGWVARESGAQVRERAAVAYNTYQKCGMNGARNLFATGF
jgi:hypothetical protein